MGRRQEAIRVSLISAGAGVALAAAMSLFGAGCVGELGGEGGETPSLTAGALDNQTGVADGVACYQDVPMRKGKMEMGVCCFDDPIAGTSECIICDAAHKCTPGGAEPGALTAGINATAWDGANAVLEPSVRPNRPVTLGAASPKVLSAFR